MRNLRAKPGNGNTVPRKHNGFPFSVRALFNSAAILFPQDKLQLLINPKNTPPAAVKQPTASSAARRKIAPVPR
jgi:hypothetical protein